MRVPLFWKRFWIGAVGFVVGVAMAVPAHAHCDGMDGPVITEALSAIESGDVTSILKWVPKHDEAEIRALFDKTLTVRVLSPEAREVADRHFLESLVRLHRAGEGVAFTGIKPSGTPIDPAVVRADAALVDGTVDRLADDIASAVRQSIQERFAAAKAARAHKDHSVEHGREYVKAYVHFVHHVEHLHQAISADAHHEAAGGGHDGH